MLVSIDEFPDSGLPWTAGPTPCVVVAMVTFEDRDAATEWDPQCRLASGPGRSPRQLQAS